jgi:hypothetical protein
MKTAPTMLGGRIEHEREVQRRAQDGVLNARHYGADQPQVARRMRAMLEDLLEVVPPERRPGLEEQLKLLESFVTRAFSDPEERAIAEVPDRLGMGQSRTRGRRGLRDPA